MHMDKLVALCKRRGFLFPSSDIYGGLNGFLDYGPLGVEFKRNVKEAWWRDMVTGLSDGRAEMPFAQEHQSRQALGLDGLDKAVGERVQIRTPRVTGRIK